MIVRLADRAARRTWQGIALASRAAFLRALHGRSSAAGPAIDRSSIRRILTVRPGGLGELVLSLPALDDLAASFPNAQLLAMAPTDLVPLLRGRPSITSSVPIDVAAGARELARRIAGLGVDLGVDLSFRDEILVPRALFLARVPHRAGLAGGGREVYLTRAARRGPSPVPVVELRARVVEAAGAAPTSSRPCYRVPDEARRGAESMLRGLGAVPPAPRVAVHPGGGSPSLRWPLEHFGDVARALAGRWHARILILAGPGEEVLGRDLERRVGEPAALVPSGDVGQLAATLSRCHLLIANHSGPLHLAGAVGVPTVSVMGPTDPVRCWPVGEEQAVLRRGSLACSPCRRRRCAPHDCLRGIGAGAVLDVAHELLRSSLSRTGPVAMEADA